MCLICFYFYHHRPLVHLLFFHFCWVNPVNLPSFFFTDTQLVRRSAAASLACPMHHVGVGQVLDPHVKSLASPSNMAWPGQVSTWKLLKIGWILKKRLVKQICPLVK